MPILRIKRENNRKYVAKTDNLNNKYVYNTGFWRKLRITYLAQHPLCENCQKNNKTTLATTVHHKYEISNGVTKQQKQNIGFNYNNLMAVCEDCHKLIHKENGR